MNFQGADILSIDQFEIADIAEIFSVAAAMEVYARREKVTRVLEGAVLGNLFLEPSTRSRVSFETAFYRLGGSVSNTIGIDGSSIVKGESLEDTACMLGGYADVLVIRHPEQGAVQKMAQATITPVINSGDGAGEHPTQALLDLYTILKEQGRTFSQIDGLSIAMVGDLKHSRTVHSLLKLLSLFKNIFFTFVAPVPLAIPSALLDLLLRRGHKVKQIEDLASGITDVDVIYMTRIQEERFAEKKEASRYRGCYSLHQSLYEKVCRPRTVILHPLPRDSRPGSNEIDSDLNDHPALAIFRQAQNGIPLRMALFAMVLDVVSLL